MHISCSSLVYFSPHANTVFTLTKNFWLQMEKIPSNPKRPVTIHDDSKNIFSSGGSNKKNQSKGGSQHVQNTTEVTFSGITSPMTPALSEALLNASKREANYSGYLITLQKSDLTEVCPPFPSLEKPHLMVKTRYISIIPRNCVYIHYAYIFIFRVI